MSGAEQVAPWNGCSKDWLRDPCTGGLGRRTRQQQALLSLLDPESLTALLSKHEMHAFAAATAPSLNTSAKHHVARSCRFDSERHKAYLSQSCNRLRPPDHNLHEGYIEVSATTNT